MHKFKYFNPVEDTFEYVFQFKYAGWYQQELLWQIYITEGGSRQRIEY
jgi:hypothetical protein